MSGNRTRWLALALSAVVIVGCLGAAGIVFLTRSAGDGFGDRWSSLRDDEVPDTPEEAQREQLLAAARDFVVRFNTYQPEMLDDEGHLPEYAAVGDLMTAKFAGVFEDNVGYAEQTVAQLGADRSATVYAVGVASQDEDSAEVLVAGTVELSYPYDEEGGGGENDEQSGDTEQGDDEQRITTGPQRFRYQVSLVKVDGRWLIDNLDDVDDGLPAFADAPATEVQSGLPTPSEPAPSTDPSGSVTDPSSSTTESPSGGDDQ